jgi:hypothetical protein
MIGGYMKQILLFVTIATTLASSALSAHSTTLGHGTVVDRSPAKIGNIALKPQPLPPRYTSALVICKKIRVENLTFN